MPSIKQKKTNIKNQLLETAKKDPVYQNVMEIFTDAELIDIQDNGKGIQRKHKTNIFKPGFSSKKRGWGLGLSLTKRIIEEIHSGKVWLLQSNNNKTIMRVIFPF